MGQTESSGSGCVVEVVPKSLNSGWLSSNISEAHPQTASDIKASTVSPGNRPWRITVNPQMELLEPEQVSKRSPGSPKQLASSSSSESEDWSPNVSVNHGSSFKMKNVVCEPKVDEGVASSETSSTTSSTRKSGSTDVGSTVSIRIPKMQLLSGFQGFSGQEFQKELEKTADKLYGVSKILTADETKCLILLLEHKDATSLLKTLTSVSNLAAFTINQDLLRRHGALVVLKELLADEDLADSSRVMLTQCVSNLAVNEQNLKEFQDCIPLLVNRYVSETSSQLEKVVCVQALTNLALHIDCRQIKHLASAVPLLYDRLWSHGKVNLPILKLLVNLSCCTDVVPYLLVSKCPPGLLDLLNENLNEDVLRRSSCFFCNLVATVDTLGLSLTDLVGDPGIFSKTNYLETVYFALFGPVGLTEIKNRVAFLVEHTDDEIAHRSHRILNHMKNIELSKNYCLN